MQRHEFLLTAQLEAHVLEVWIEAGWLLPREAGEPFSDVDLARARLIRDLEHLGVNDEGVPVILDLVDQLHGLRRTMRDLLDAVGAQPDATRSQILTRIRDDGPG